MDYAMLSTAIQGSNHLLPPAEILPQLALSNLTGSSNRLYASFDHNVKKVAELTERLEAVITGLSHALLRDKIPGEAEETILEDAVKLA